MSKQNVLILFGGQSAEHEISLRSARSVYEALDKHKYHISLVGISKEGRWYGCGPEALLCTSRPGEALPQVQGAPASALALPMGEKALISRYADGNQSFPSLSSLDVVFPVLHGPMGEDGTVQGLLKLSGCAFVGSDVLGSAVCMDKDVTKRLLAAAHIPVTAYRVVRAGDEACYTYQDLTRELGPVLFVKPANMGSSVGVSRVVTEAQYHRAVAEAMQFDTKVLVEQAASLQKPREIEIALLGGEGQVEASVPGEVVPFHEFYSYEAKYLDDKGADLRIPAPLSQEICVRLQAFAKKAFVALECHGMARVDFFLTVDGQMYVNEVNTIPGFTDISLYPMLWKASGVSYGDLLDRLIQLAIQRDHIRKRLRMGF